MERKRQKMRKHRKTRKCRNSKDMKAIVEGWLEVEQNLKGKGGSSLIICTIIGPSVLWIKAYIALMFMTYVMSKKIMKMRRILLNCFVRGIKTVEDIFDDNNSTVDDLKGKIFDKITRQEKNFDRDFALYKRDFSRPNSDLVFNVNIKY